MKMTVGLGTVQSVSPQMIASMTVLQCGTQELGEYLEELSYENPVMDLQEPEQSDASKDSALVDKLRWLRGSDRQNRSYYSDGERDSVDQYLRTGQDMSLGDFVKEQILTLDVPKEIRAAMETVVELLDERGLFDSTVCEIARLAHCCETVAAEALDLVRALEPAGVAAESVQQALIRQLETMEKPVALRLVQEQFTHLGSWSDQRIAREMGISVASVRAAKNVIAALRPYPSNGFASREDIQYVTPDVSIFPENGELKAVVEEGYLPKVQINAKYLEMLETCLLYTSDAADEL